MEALRATAEQDQIQEKWLLAQQCLGDFVPADPGRVQKSYREPFKPIAAVSKSASSMASLTAVYLPVQKL